MPRRAAWLVVAALLLGGLAASRGERVEANMPQCAARGALVGYLAQRYGEAPAWAGLSDGGQSMLELLVNPDKGSWSLIGTRAGRQSCLVSAGEGARFIAVPLTGSDS